MAMATPPRVRRKPAPVLDDVRDENTPLATERVKRQSFTLYPDAPVSPQLSIHASSSSQQQQQQPHYTRRATQSITTTTSTPTRTRLARLLLPTPSSPTSVRVRKPIISGPAPAELPAGMVPPELAALAKSQRPMALRPLQLPVISPTSSESSAASEDSRASADTEATTPPLSPIDPISPRTSPHKSKFKTSKPVPHPPLTVPSEATLAQAVRLPLVAPSGVRVPFGVLLGQPQTPDSKPPVPRRTLVIFLRHFWCPLCQDYMVALARGVRAINHHPISDDSTSPPGSPTMPVFANPAGPNYDPIPMPSSARVPTSPSPSESCPACTPSGSVTLAYLDGLVGGDTNDCACDDEEEGTHLLLIAPGSHTLIRRYLASFGFPRELVTPTTEYPHSTSSSDDGYSYAEKAFNLGDPLYSPVPSHVDGYRPRSRGQGRGGIASVRMFVDPQPLEGLYAALGMGWMVSAAGGPGAPASRNHADLSFGEIQVVGPTPPASPAPIPFPTLGSCGSSAGLHLQTLAEQWQSDSAAHEKIEQQQQKTGEEDPHAACGDTEGYVTHGVLSGVGAVVMRALRAGMPIWARGGDIGLLGGEFVFEVGPTSELPTASSSLRCTYAHRMQTTRGHAGVARVLAAAGVNLPEGFSFETNNKGMTKGTLRKRDPKTSLPRSASADVANLKSRIIAKPPLLPRSISMAPVLSSPLAAAAGAAGPSSSPSSSSRPTTPISDPEPQPPRRPSAVPRSMSTPITISSSTSASSRGMSMFARFAGPKGARAPDVVPEEPAPGLPRSASTPPGTVLQDEVGHGHGVLKGAAAVWEGRGRHALWDKDKDKGEGRLNHWGGVGVIWEGRIAKEGKTRVREPAIPATLSTSSSRPWALAAAAAGSCDSLTSLASSSEEIRQQPEEGSSSSLSFSSPGVPAKELTESSSDSAASEMYRYAGGGSHMYLNAEAEEEEGYASGLEADDEGSQNGRFLSARAKYEEDSVSEYSDALDSMGDSWIRARTLSLARLRARKEARRGEGFGVDES